MQLYLLCPKQLDQRTYRPHPTQENGYLQVHLTSVIHETSWMASDTSSTKVPTNQLICETLTWIQANLFPIGGMMHQHCNQLA